MAVPSKLQADVIVAGSGPGGATVARELARQGKQVLLLERGIDDRTHAYYGTYLGALIYTDRRSLLFTQEGLNIIRPLMVGGATSMYCGCAAPPPDWLKGKYGVDIDAEVAETIEELEIAPLPADAARRGLHTRGASGPGPGLRLAAAAQVHVSPGAARRFDCGAKCMLGCRCGAKWNAAEYVDEAVAAGARLRTRATVERVLVEDGHAAGVAGTLAGEPFSVTAGTVVLAAGGIGTPRILQASGFPAAGQGMTMDVTVMVYGFVKERGTGNEPPMTWSWENRETGFMLSTLIDPWLLYPDHHCPQGLALPAALAALEQHPGGDDQAQRRRVGRRLPQRSDQQAADGP